MFATIATGNIDAADWLFLIGAVLCGVAAIGATGLVSGVVARLSTFFFYAGVTLAVVAWLIL